MVIIHVVKPAEFVIFFCVVFLFVLFFSLLTRDIICVSLGCIGWLLVAVWPLPGINRREFQRPAERLH